MADQANIFSMRYLHRVILDTVKVLAACESLLVRMM